MNLPCHIQNTRFLDIGGGAKVRWKNCWDPPKKALEHGFNAASLHRESMSCEIEILRKKYFIIPAATALLLSCDSATQSIKKKGGSVFCASTLVVLGVVNWSIIILLQINSRLRLVGCFSRMCVLEHNIVCWLFIYSESYTSVSPSIELAKWKGGGLGESRLTVWRRIFKYLRSWLLGRAVPSPHSSLSLAADGLSHWKPSWALDFKVTKVASTAPTTGGSSPLLKQNKMNGCWGGMWVSVGFP